MLAPDDLALGGRVTGTGADRAASARLSIRDTVLVDDVGGGVVLFVTSDPDRRIARNHRALAW